MPDGALAIGDLTAPVLTPTQREILEQLEGLSVDLDTAGLIGEAIVKTGWTTSGQPTFGHALMHTPEPSTPTAATPTSTA